MKNLSVILSLVFASISYGQQITNINQLVSPDCNNSAAFEQVEIELSGLNANTNYNVVAYLGNSPIFPQTSIQNQSGSFAFNYANLTQGGTYDFYLYDADATDVFGAVLNFIDHSTYFADWPPVVTAQTFSATNPTCFGFSDGSILVQAGGGTVNDPSQDYNISINGPTSVNTNANLSTINGLSAGTYTVTVTDLLNCPATTTFTLVDPPQLQVNPTITSNYNGADISCTADSDGSVTATTSGGTNPINPIVWEDSNNNLVNPNQLSAGTYTAIATDANGCIATQGITLIDPQQLQVSTTITSNYNGANISCNGFSDGQITASSIGGTGFINYSWNPNINQNTSIANSLSAGTYTVTVTDANNCTAQSTETLTEPTTISTSVITVSEPTCNNSNDGSIIITASGGISPSGYYFSTDGGQTFTPALNTNIGTTSPLTANGLSIGFYQITVQDQNGCSADTSHDLTGPTQLQISANIVAEPSCFGNSDGELSATTTGGTPVYNSPVWTDVNSGNTVSPVGLTSGIYSVSITDANGCPANNQIVLTEPSDITAPNLVFDNISCFGANDGSINAGIPSGGVPGPGNQYFFSWNPSGSTSNISNLTPGIYSLTITDGNLCNNNSPINVTITEPQELIINLLDHGDANCFSDFNGFIQPNITGGTLPYTSIFWNGPNGFLSNNININSLEAGLYELTIEDANNCIVNEFQTIEQPLELIASDSVVNVSCNGGNDGEIWLEISGGSSPYSVDINGSPVIATGNNFGFGYSAGSYQVIVTDAAGCKDTIISTITEPASYPSININNFDISCFGGADGEISVSGQGGTGPYTFINQLNQQTVPFGTAVTYSGLSIGSYIIDLIDANGCFTTTNQTLTQNQLITAGFITTDVSVNGANDGSIIEDLFGGGQVTGGVQPYSYSWITVPPSPFSSSSLNLQNLPPNTYQLTITDSLGCERTFQEVVNEPNCDVVINASLTQPDCYNDNGEIYWSIDNGVPNYYSTLQVDYDFDGNNDSIVFDSLIFNSPPYGLPIPYSAPSGSYQLIVADAVGCLAVYNYVLNNPDSLAILEEFSTDVTCFGYNNGTFTATAIGGISPYTYSFDGINNGNSPFINNLTPGVHTGIVIDANGCQDTLLFNVDEPTPINVNLFPTSPDCYGNLGEVSAVATGGETFNSGVYTYQWGPNANIGGNTQTQQTAVNLLGNQIYTVTVTDQSSTPGGCSSTESIFLDEPADIIVSPVFTTTEISCFDANDGGFIINPSGGVGTLITQWYNTTDPTTIISIGDTITNLGSGTYGFNIIDDVTGCNLGSINTALNGSLTLSNPQVFDVNINVNPISLSGACDGAASISTFSGGQFPYTYQWSTGNTNPTISALCDGNYFVVVTDDFGCTDTEFFNLQDPNCDIQITSVIDTIECFDDYASISVNFSGGISPYNSFLIGTNGLDTIINEINNNFFTYDSLTLGNYYVYVEDAGVNSCASVLNFYIDEPAPFVLSLDSITPLNCFADTDSEVWISWNGGQFGFTNGVINSPNIIAPGLSFNTQPGTNGAGTYSVIAQDDLGCVASGTSPTELTFVINQPDELFVSILSTTPICSGTATGTALASIVGGTPPYSIQWYDINNNLIESGSFLLDSIPSGTNYSVQVTDANGCQTFDIFDIVPVPNLDLINSNILSPTCYNGNNGFVSFDIVGGNSPYNIIWSPSGNTTNTANNLQAGDYEIIVFDSLLCSDTFNIVVPETPELIANINIINEISCNTNSGVSNDGVLDVSIIGGNPGAHSINWYVNNSAISYSTSPLINTLTQAFYEVQVFDSQGCFDSDTITIDAPEELEIVLNQLTHVAPCNGDATGQISVTPIGGDSSSYTYQWNDINLQTGSTASFLTAGNYTVIVNDNSGCADTAAFSVEEPSEIVIGVTVNDVSCSGGNDGDAIAQVTGGYAPWSYQWDDINLSVGNSAVDLTAGTYTVTVQDSLGCSVTSAPVIVSEPQPLQISTSSTMISCYGGSDGTASVTGSGGIQPYNWDWGNGINTNTITGLSQGIYFVTIIDAEGCSISASQQVNSYTPIEMNLDSSVTTCSDGILSVSITGGNPAPAYNYNWYIIDSLGGPDVLVGQTQTVNQLVPGTYWLEASDANGCFNSDTIVIPSLEDISAVITTTNVTCNGLDNGLIDVVVSNGNPSFSWSFDNQIFSQPNPSNQIQISGLSPSIYTLFIKDSDNCVESFSNIIITEPLEITFDSTFSSDPNCYGDSTGIVSFQVNGGIYPYDLTLNNLIQISTFDSLYTDSLLPHGQYQYDITDDNGCQNSFIVNIIDPVPLTAQVSTISNFNGFGTSCYNSNDGELSVNVNGGVLPYTYLVDSVATATLNAFSLNFSNLSSGEHLVTIFDNNNCKTELTHNITSPDTLNIDFNQLSNYSGFMIECFGDQNGSIELQGAGGVPPYDFSTDGSGQSYTHLNQFNPITLINLNAANNIYILRDANNCLDTLSLTITQPDELSVVTNISEDIQCYGDSSAELSIFVSGGVFPFDYNIQSVLNSITQNNYDSVLIATNLVAGLYSGLIVDNNNCEVQVNPIFVDQPDQISYDLVTDQITCFDAEDGELTLNNFNGGVGNYILEVYGPQGSLTNPVLIDQSNTQYFENNLLPGQYSIYVTDSNLCQVNSVVNIMNPEILNGIVFSDSLNCYSSIDGSVEILIQGGTSPFSIEFLNMNYSTSDSIFIINNLPAIEQESLIIYDNNNCSTDVSVDVYQPEPIVSSVINNDIDCYGENTGSSIVQTIGGVGPYNYLLIDETNTILSTGSDSVSGLFYGEYTWIITDHNGCNDTLNFYITESQEISFVADTIKNVSCFSGTDGMISISNLNSNAYSVFWSTGDTISTIKDLPVGVYYCTVIDEFDCFKVDSFDISQPEPLLVYSEVTNASCKELSDASIFTSIQGGVEPYDLLLSSYNHNDTIFNVLSNDFNTLSYGDYLLTVIDDNDCVINDSLNISFEGGLNCIASFEPTFTPNGDNINDLFDPLIQYFDEVELFIYNRWGQLVYYETGISPNWDGKNQNGILQPTADYYYIIDYSDDSMETINGVITLIK